MTVPARIGAGLRLMRPAQWPVLSAQLVVSILLSAPAAGAARQQWWVQLDFRHLAVAWLVWVVMLNGGTLAFNSAFDRDEGPVAYLARPPLPPPGLAPAALLLMVGGGILGLWQVGLWFGLAVLGAVGLSVLYSHPVSRWKSRPGLDLITNIVGYGFGTTVAGLSAAVGRVPTPGGWWFAVGFGLLFGSFYPLTQIYQTTADRARGDSTLTTALGVRPALVLALALGLGAGGTLLAGCWVSGRDRWLFLLGLVLSGWCAHLVWWLRHSTTWTDSQHERGMYQALVLWALVDVALAGVWLLN